MQYELVVPLKDRSVLRELKCGDLIYITGTIVTLRDLGHKRILDLYSRGLRPPIDLRNGVVFHAGPIAMKRDNEWRIVAIGPTTSARMDSYAYSLVEKTGVAIVLGKGGMGMNMRRACQDYTAIYAELVGGTASLITKAIKRVVDVYWLDLGVPEAMWILEVYRLGPAIVVIDTRGEDLHELVMREARKRFKGLIHHEKHSRSMSSKSV